MTQHQSPARPLIGTLLGLAALVLTTLSSAQDRYPSKPVQISSRRSYARDLNLGELQER